MKPSSSKPSWQRIEALFPDLLALPAPRRAAFLDRHCADDPMLRAELESLLAAAEGESCLDRPLNLNPPADPLELPVMPPNEHIGPWRIVRLLGRGGMGEVYLGRRVEGGFNQTVAIKRLREDAIEHADRFNAERTILAQLNHPNIARLLGGGISDDGRAWMAMDYVEGESLTAYVNRLQLDLPARIALFDQICAAVAYAHTHLVVHRDLKPSNILVTPEGQVKLLDFGVAKLLDRDAETHLTRTAPLTPEHAAPEQLEGAVATTAVDIYTLGILLYELLCGQRPWAAGSTPISLVVDRLLREEPPPPSRAVAGPHATARAKAIRGDLDAIVLRCLRKSPEARYPTVDALRDDLRRWRSHQPVDARRGAAGYAMRRWMWRHRFGISAVSLVFITLLVGLSMALWQAKRAQQQAWRAEQVKQLVLAVFRENDPLSRPDRESRTPAQLIAEGVDMAERELADDPSLLAELLSDFGEVQLNLDDPVGGRSTLDRALALRRQLHRGDHLEIAEILRKLTRAHAMEGNGDAVLKVADDALAMLERLGQASSPEAGRLMVAKGMVQINRKDRELALQTLREGQLLLEANLGRAHPEAIRALYRVGQALEQLRRDDEAEAVTRDAVGRMEVLAGRDSPQLIQPLGMLAGIVRRSDPAQAHAFYERAIGLGRRYLGANHRQVAELLSRQANLHRLQGNLLKAHDLFNAAEAAMPAEAKGERTQLLASRGQLYLDMDRLPEAERDLAEAFQLRRETMGDNAGITWYAASLWGRSLRRLGKLAQAENVQRDALARLQNILGPDAYQNVLLLDALVETLSERGQHDEAIVLARRSLELTGKSYPATHALIAERQQRLAHALAQSPGDEAHAEALTHCDQAVATYQTAPPEELPRYIHALIACAELRLQVNDVEGARHQLQTALQQQETPATDVLRVRAAKLLATTAPLP